MGVKSKNHARQGLNILSGSQDGTVEAKKFLESPEDPYYLPSDAETSQIRWTKTSQEADVDSKFNKSQSHSQKATNRKLASPRKATALKPKGVKGTSGAAVATAEPQARAARICPSPTKRKLACPAAITVQPQGKLLSVSREERKKGRSPKKASKARAPDLVTVTEPPTLEDPTPEERPRKVARKEKQAWSLLNRETNCSQEDQQEAKKLEKAEILVKTFPDRPSSFPEGGSDAHQERRAAHHSREGTDPSRPSTQGFSRSSLRSLGKQTKGPAVSDDPETGCVQKPLKGDNLITCSPAMTEALDEIENRLPQQSSHGIQASLEAAPQTSVNPQPSSKVEGEEGRKPQLAARILPQGFDVSKRDPGQRGLAQRGKPKTRQPSRLAKDSRPDSQEPRGSLPKPKIVPKDKVQTLANPAAAKGKGPQDGLRTPLLLRNALSSGLARVLSGGGLSTPAPAVTVMEAQESGEQRQIQDTMLYALDGLCSSASQSTQRESASTLLDLCSTTRRGRLAFMADGIFLEAVAAARQLLCRSWDADTAAMFGAMLLCCCREANGQAVMACKAGVTFLTFLLQKGVDHHRSQQDPPQVSPAVGKRVEKVLGDGAIQRSLDRDLISSPAALASLIIICGTDPQHTTVNTEKLKGGLREHGAIDCIADCVASLGTAGQEGLSWLLHFCLVALENCSFACQEIETYLVSLLCQRETTRIGFGKVLVGLIDGLEGERLLNKEQAARRRECLHCALSVLMNMTQQSEAGCTQVVDAGFLGIAARMLCNFAAKCRESRDALMDGIVIISATLGLLINIAESNCSSMLDLLNHPLPENCTFVSLLCNFVEQRWLPKDVHLSSGEEVTADELHAHEDEGKVAAGQIYASLLAGFLIAGSGETKKEVAACLADRSVQPVIDGVQRCLDFYLSTGSITERTESSLRKLLSTLTSEEEAGKGS